MRLIIGSFLVLIAVSAFAKVPKKGEFVMPKKDKVAVYTNKIRELHEKAIYTVNQDNKLQVVEVKGDYVKVKNKKDQTGWVEKHLIASLKKGAIHTFLDATVLGYLDNPEAIYILEGDGSPDIKLKLERSFVESLKQNVDRETITRQTK